MRVIVKTFLLENIFSLTNMGIESEKLRITYVKELNQNLAHMVLAYYPYPGAEPLILDNINKKYSARVKKN